MAICIVSLYDGCIEVFNDSGSKVLNIGSEGSGDGQFDDPLGIALRGDVMYVADTLNYRIQKLTLSGNFIYIQVWFKGKWRRYADYALTPTWYMS